MTQLIKISMVAVMGSSMLLASADMMKKYDVKSGKIEYEIKGSGDIMGMVKIKTIGKKRVIFDNYGVKDLTEESKVTKETTGGQTKVNKEHSIKYMNGGIVYSVDFDKKVIIRMENPAMAMGALFGGGKNIKQTGESMMKSMGGKKTGTDKVLGYSCDVWDLMGVKQCIHKGIPLRIESNVMGMKSVEIATKAEFDISLSKDDFKLPEYPFTDMYGAPLNIDRDKLDEMDVKQSAKSSQEAADGAKAMTAAMGALKESGFDMSNPDVETTEDQKMAMQKAMMNAMGGEEAMLAKEKQEILSEADKIPQIIKCFENANSVKAANACEREYDNEDPEHHAEWNDVIKADLLKDIRTFKDAIPCIEKAKTFRAFSMCLPQE